MTTVKVPVDFTIAAEDLDTAVNNFDAFLKLCYKDYAKLYNVIDYELPVGYPVEDL